MRGKVVKVPQVMQMEALECGAACLTMILAYYGLWMPLEKVRVDCGVSRDGSKASNVVKAARRYGLAAKGATFSAEALQRQAPFPCIIFWNFNHFVVLDGFRGNKAYLNDPARGQVRISMEEFNKSFTGVTLLFERTDAFVEGGQRPNPITYATSRLKGLGAPILFVMLTAAISSIVTILHTSLGKVFMDGVLRQHHYDWLASLSVVMLLLAGIGVVVAVLNAVYLMRIQGKIAVVSSSRFMNHLLHLPVGFYAQRMVGDLQQRHAANETIAFALISQLAPVLINAVMLVLYLAVMLRYSVLLTAVGMVSVLLNSFLSLYISRKRVNISRAAMSDSGKLYATTISGVEMIETIKSSGAEVGYFGRWAGYQASVSEGKARSTRLNEYLGTVSIAVSSLANILVLVLGIWRIVEGDFTPGMLLAFTGLLTNFMAPVREVIGLGQTIQEMQTQMERIEDVMRYKVDVPERGSEEEKLAEGKEDFGGEKLFGKVDLDGISFGYSPLEPPLIEDFDLHLKPGQWVALVGPSGCGKSTIAKLVSGLYEPWEGTVRFDDVPAGEISRSVLRGSLAVVDQDIITFDDTIIDNVRLWDKSIEDYQVILACRDAGIHEAILERDGGYNSGILPGGHNFSGGQLQRLEIARVLAQEPTIIILDEATSALDAQTEEDVIRRIRDREISCIVVAHRLSTIRDCDEIIVLDDGKVVERGTHDELMAADGAYAELVRSN